MQALVRELAAQNSGLCVITARLEVADIAGRAGAVSKDLDRLPPDAGAALLLRYEVQGSDAELRRASKEFGGHALALALLGTYLRDVLGGDVRRRNEVALLDETIEQGGHARRVMTSYENWLTQPDTCGRQGDACVARRSSVRRTIRWPRTAHPPSPGPLRSSRRRRRYLRSARQTADHRPDGWPRRRRPLVQSPSPSTQGPPTLSGRPAPTISTPIPWCANTSGNGCVMTGLMRGELVTSDYTSTTRTTTDELPDTLEGLLPLYSAVVHGCQAGRVQEARVDVYRRRILRGGEFFSIHKLGALSTELTALAAFFVRPWDRPDPRLAEAAQAWILNQAGFVLRALGRLPEAVQPMRAGLDAEIVEKRWKEAATAAGNLSELTLALGDAAAAVQAGEKSLELADRSGDWQNQVANRTILAGALHEAGRWSESAAAFREAEAVQADRQSQYPRLYSLWGYRYCDLLLSVAEPEDGSGLGGRKYREACEEVRERATQALQVASSNDWVLDIALDHLSLGRAALGLALTMPGGFDEAAEHLNRAVDGLRQAGAEHHIPHGLLARAIPHRQRAARAEGNPTTHLQAAEADLHEAGDIAERGHMRLHQGRRPSGTHPPPPPDQERRRRPPPPGAGPRAGDRVRLRSSGAGGGVVDVGGGGGPGGLARQRLTRRFCCWQTAGACLGDASHFVSGWYKFFESLEQCKAFLERAKRATQASPLRPCSRRAGKEVPATAGRRYAP